MPQHNMENSRSQWQQGLRPPWISRVAGGQSPASSGAESDTESSSTESEKVSEGGEAIRRRKRNLPAGCVWWLCLLLFFCFVFFLVLCKKAGCRLTESPAITLCAPPANHRDRPAKGRAEDWGEQDPEVSSHLWDSSYLAQTKNEDTSLVFFQAKP